MHSASRRRGRSAKTSSCGTRRAGGTFSWWCRGRRAPTLRALAAQLESSKLSFASAERLEKYLGLKQGEVTPLGVLNDADAAVEVVFDRGLERFPCLGVHPNDNTATVWLSLADILRVVEGNGNEIRWVTL